MDPNESVKDLKQADPEQPAGHINTIKDGSPMNKAYGSSRSTSTKSHHSRKSSSHHKHHYKNEYSYDQSNPSQSYTPTDTYTYGSTTNSRQTPHSQRSTKSRSRNIGEDSIGSSITSSIQDSVLASGQSSTNPTDSIYTHSFNGKIESPGPQGDPPLKRTFMNDTSDSDDYADFDQGNGSPIRQNAIFRKPEWKFPVRRVPRNDDDQLYETLRERFSVKNIVSQLKRST